MTFLRITAAVAVHSVALVAQSSYEWVIEPSQDTAIFSDSGATSSGRGPIVSGRTVSNGVRRALVRFDLTALAPAALIQDVRLEMVLTRTNAAPAATSLHRVTSAWGEGASVSFGGSGAPATPGDATWTDRFFGQSAWLAPGGDFDPVPSVTALVGNPAIHVWESAAAMRADVSSWLADPFSNFGWIVVTDEDKESAKLWHSRETGGPAERPRLTIRYLAPSGTGVWPSGQGCQTPGGETLKLRASGAPTLGNAGFMLQGLDGPALVTSVLALGLGRAPVPLVFNANLCSFALDPQAPAGLLFATFDGAGRAGHPLPIPNAPGLVGLALDLQMLAVGAGADTWASNVLTVVFGS